MAVIMSRQMKAENMAAEMKEARKKWQREKKKRQAARAAAPYLSREEKQEAAEKFQAELLKVTRGQETGPGEVRPGSGAVQPAAEGVRAGAEAPEKGQKNRGPSAAARAPEAAAGGKRSEAVAPARVKPNRRENEFMLNLMILRNTLRVNAPACRERARAAGKWVWRDMRLMLTLVNRIQEQLLATMPESRDEYYSAYAKHGHYELRIDGPVRNGRHLLVTDRHLAAMAEAAMKSECILCMREGNEINQCELREALLDAAAPTAIHDGDSLFRKCEYRDAAGQLVQGKDVTV